MHFNSFCCANNDTVDQDERPVTNTKNEATIDVKDIANTKKLQSCDVRSCDECKLILGGQSHTFCTDCYKSMLMDDSTVSLVHAFIETIKTLDIDILKTLNEKVKALTDENKELKKLN